MLSLPMMLLGSTHTSPSSTLASLSPESDHWTPLKSSDGFTSPLIDWANCSNSVCSDETNIFESAFIQYPPSPAPTYPDPPVIMTPLLWFEPDPRPPREGGSGRGARSRSIKKEESCARPEPYRPPMQAKIPPEKGKKEFRCIHSGCWMVFNKRNALEQHILTHTGEQPHACEHCKRRFSLKCNLRRHYRTCKEAQHNSSDHSSSNSSASSSTSPSTTSASASSSPPFIPQ